MRRRILSLLLVVCVLVSMLPLQALATDTQQTLLSSEPAEELPFSDVDKGSWYYDAVDYAYKHGLFNGTSGNTFSPNDAMTRAMFVTVIGRMVGVDVSEYENKSTFPDVKADAYYAPYVAWAVEHGITKGNGDGLFAPDEPVNREQMATFIARLFDAFGYTYPQENAKGSPIDLDSISGYAREYVLKLWACGMLKGDSAGNFNPKNNATRAECATFLMRIDEHLVNIGVKEYPSDEEPEKEPEEEEEPVIIPSIGGNNNYTVTFQDGDRVIDRITVAKTSRSALFLQHTKQLRKMQSLWAGILTKS